MHRLCQWTVVFVSLALSAGCKNEAVPSPSQRATATITKIVADPGDIQISGLPVNWSSVGLQFVTDRHPPVTGTGYVESSIQTYFMTQIIGSECSEAERAPSEVAEETFQPGYVRLEIVIQSPAGKHAELFESTSSISISTSAPNIISISTFKRIDNPETRPSLFGFQTIEDQLKH